MVNVLKLRGKMVEKEVNVAELAKRIGVDTSTLYRKLNAAEESFTIKEANLITKELDLSKEEAVEIFFAHDVADKRQVEGGNDGEEQK